MIPPVNADSQALAESARRVLRDHLDSAGVGAPFTPARWAQLAELGWFAVALDEDAGGLGLGPAPASVLLETLAPAVLREPLASQLARAGQVLARALPGALRDRTLAAWLDGRTLVALVDDHAGQDPARRAVFDVEGEHIVLSLTQAGVLDAPLAETLLVVAHAAGDTRDRRLFVVPAKVCTCTPRTLFDGRVVGDVHAERLVLATDSTLTFDVDLDTVLEEASLFHALLLAADTLGLARALCEMTRGYLAQREQFGRRLADFQALQHRLVDMHLALTRLESLLELARFQVDTAGLAGAASFIAAAKTAAGLQGRHIAHEAMQLHGAIGLTAELDLACLVRRMTANELLAGATEQELSHFAALRGWLAPAT